MTGPVPMSGFVKYHAAGNDYLVVGGLPGLDPSSRDWPAAARVLCDRNRGIGADGVVVGPVGEAAAGEPVGLRLFNCDGGECERSANGLRIFALHLAARHGAGPDLVLRTRAGLAAAHVRDLDAGVVSVAIGRPTFDPRAVPVLGADAPALRVPIDVDGRHVEATCLNNGNPHAVVPMPALSPALTAELGPRIARHPRFPERTNVEFVRVRDTATIEIEIYERGAGRTLASGSGACAAASAAHALGLVGHHVTVGMPGGDVVVDLDADGAVTVTGSAEPIAEGVVADALLRRIHSVVPLGASR